MTARGNRTGAASRRAALHDAAPVYVIAILLVLTVAAATTGCAERTDPGATTTLAGPPPKTTSPGGATPATFDGTSGTTSGAPGATSAPGTSTTAGPGRVTGDLEALGRLAIAQYQAQDLTGAALTYQAMLALDDTDPLIHNNYANVLRDLGRSAEAEKEYERALALDPTLATTYLNLAALHLRDQNTAKAMSVLNRGIAATAGADRLRLQELKSQIAG